jgi:predicted RNase H-like HicB family nuclease
MSHYIAIVHKSADSCYGVHFPDLPGCVSAGDTLDEAIAAAGEALRFYAEDARAMPAPRALDAVRADADVRRDIEEGGAFVAIPLLLDAGRSVRVNITMDAGLLASIDAAAARRGLTRSAFLAQAAREKISS